MLSVSFSKMCVRESGVTLNMKMCVLWNMKCEDSFSFNFWLSWTGFLFLLCPPTHTHTHAHITHTHEIRSFQKAGERREKKHVAICICSAEFNMSRAGGAFLLGPIPWRHIHLWEMVGRTKEDCPHGSAQACLNTRARSRTQISTVAKHTHTHIYSTCTQMHVFTQTQSSDRDRLVWQQLQTWSNRGRRREPGRKRVERDTER